MVQTIHLLGNQATTPSYNKTKNHGIFWLFPDAKENFFRLYTVTSSKKMIGILVALVVILLLRYFLLKRLRHRFPIFPKAAICDAQPVFPKSFFFGVSVCAYQVEGDMPPSNWTLWEQQRDEHGNHRAPIDPIKCDGYNRFLSDAQLAKSMGCNMYRLSFSWTRLNPRPGKFDKSVMAVYRGWLIQLREMGLEPLLTLWHWEHPAWLEEKGGFLGPEFVRYYEEYVDFVLRSVCDVCDYYHSVNEPIGYIASSILAGMFPPGKGSLRTAFDGLCTLMTCHATMYKIAHRLNNKARVSFSHAVVPFTPMHSWSVIEHVMAHVMNVTNKMAFEMFTTGTLNFLWMSKKIPDIKGTLDFISLNHYYVGYVSIDWRDWGKINGNGPTQPFLSYGLSFLPMNDMGWGMNGGSLAATTEWVHREYNKGKLDVPIMITEHGAADAEDFKRQWFLRESLWHLSTITDHVPLIGYLHWTLMDNYEWADGMAKKFGLFETVPETLERKPRKSVEIYTNIIKASSRD